MLTVESKRHDGVAQEYRIETACILGCDAASLIPLPASAGKRALRVLTESSGVFSIVDLGCPTGVFVNGERIVRYGPLRVEDVIVVSGQTLRIKSLSANKMQSINADTAFMNPSSDIATAEVLPLKRPPTMAESNALPESVAEEKKLTTQLSVEDRAHQLALSTNAGILHAELIKTLDLRRQDVTRMGDVELRAVASKLIKELIDKLPLPAQTDPHELEKFVLDEAVGLGVLESLLADPSVTEIMVNGAEDIFVERAGQSRRSDIAFSSEKALMGVIERIVSPIGRRVDESTPLCDARLKDGSRVNIVIRPIALKGPSVSIRKFAQRRLQVDDLVKFGSVDEGMVRFLRICVEQKKNIIISGGTGSGKTTLLNVISNLIPPFERIVTIEDAAELKLYHDNLVTLEARPANVEGRGQVSIRELVKNSLRMRPDRIVVGECRGGEALDMLQAMNTGHDGSLTTAHANSPRDMLSRLEVMVLMAGMDLPVTAIREQIASAVQIIVQQTRFACGTRKVTSITEITGMERGVIQMQEIFRFQRLGFFDDGKVRGQFMPCGYVPTFYEELREQGVDLDLSIFGADNEEMNRHVSGQVGNA
ncbi:ATPase, T2SS/T4P/T4SS family [Undibacterium sp. CY21W]|uniref:ATPase, T2SS/T4P/T4SS family n=1 Tax=Undibacterium sp. CY21W TaxID=2762293 RepID=UPI00164AAB7E|nr:ATPase, T2SS/T4P/T4SS family [Undibacterium sp. CY21W]MBC3927415.1 CpaF family protein [Undibacterium sp. CY21W]